MVGVEIYGDIWQRVGESGSIEKITHSCANTLAADALLSYASLKGYIIIGEYNLLYTRNVFSYIYVI